MIKVNALVKRFGLKIILNKLDFSAAAGQCVVLMGPNGSGKTTFLRILATLSKATAGNVSITGYLLPTQAIMVRKNIGVVLHHTMLYENLSAEENIQFFARFYNLPDSNQRVAEVIDQVGLYHRRKDIVRTFSRGMQQRLSIARAILHEPSVLILDEPYTGLDEAASVILDEVISHFIEEQRTVIMSSHDVKMKLESVSRFDVLMKGKIAASWTPTEVPSGGLHALYQDAIRS